MARLKPKIKRPNIPPKMRAEAMAKNKGICLDPSGCTKPGTICEHVQPFYICLEHKIENLEPRCTDHAKEKTAAEQPLLSKVRRLTGYTKCQWTGTNQHKGRIANRGFPPKPEGYKHKWGSKALARKQETK